MSDSSIQIVSINELKPYDKNPRFNAGAVDAVASSIKNFGFKQPIVVDKDYVIIVGHTRWQAGKQLGLTEVPCIIAEDLSQEKAKAYRLADNKVGELADWNYTLLDIELEELQDLDIDMSEFGFDIDDGYETTSEKMKNNPIDKGPLADTFLIAPFSILDARRGLWQERKRKWMELGIRSEIGRGENLTFARSLDVGSLKGTSIFDPVLCELVYRWFLPDDGSLVFDAFAGGSVRGVIASALGHSYTGIELRKEQVEANYSNAHEIKIKDNINWINDDAMNMDQYVEDGTQDLFFICPPYFDLEVYSDEEGDISNMNYDNFTKFYSEIVRKGARKVKENRFAVVVISDVRDKKTGLYRDLVGVTKSAMAEAGFGFYNDVVLINGMGSSALRIRKNMVNRKMVRTHQSVLVFYNGDHTEIKNTFPELDIIEDELFDEFDE